MTRQLGFAAILAMAILSLASARGPPLTRPADACQACLVSVRILEDLLCDPAATDFLVDFVEKQICPHMGDKMQCRNLAEGLLPTVIQWFRASATPASLCSSAGVCGAAVLQVAPLNKPALRVRDTAQCAMCRFVVRTVQEQLENSQALEKAKEVALQVCGDLPGELAEGCSDLVNTYWPVVAELVEEMDPETVCSLVGLCVEAFAAVKPPALPAALMQALAGSELLRRPPPPPVFSALLGLPPPLFAVPGAGMMGAMGHGGAGMDQSSWANGQEQDGVKPWWLATMPANGPMGPPLVDNAACDYCKLAVIEAHSLISNPQVQAEVCNYTKAVCDSFQGFSDMCKAYVDMYAPLVFTLLEQYLVPDAVCAQTGLCPPPPVEGSLADSHSTSWTCWLMDGWVGSALRHLGLGALLPAHHQHGHDQHDPAVQLERQ